MILPDSDKLCHGIFDVEHIMCLEVPCDILGMYHGAFVVFLEFYVHYRLKVDGQ